MKIVVFVAVVAVLVFSIAVPALAWGVEFATGIVQGALAGQATPELGDTNDSVLTAIFDQSYPPNPFFPPSPINPGR